MLIRSTEDACFVMLRNGLTLEVIYDRVLSGRSFDSQAANDDRPSPSSAVWLMGEDVVVELVAGQA